MGPNLDHVPCFFQELLLPLISALGALTESLNCTHIRVSLLEFRSKINECCAPPVEHGSLLNMHAFVLSSLTKATQNPQMLETLQWAPALRFWAIWQQQGDKQTKSLLVTLLLPNCPNSAFTSLLSQPTTSSGDDC